MFESPYLDQNQNAFEFHRKNKIEFKFSENFD